MKTKNINSLDLRSITRDSDKLRSTVMLHVDWDVRIKWLMFGEANMRCFNSKKQWLLSAYLNNGTTDFEHDSAYAFRLPLIGVQFDDVNHQVTSFTAWIDSNNPSDFGIPSSGYDPTKQEGSFICKDCKDEQHVIVPEGFYIPPFDQNLFDLVKGKQVEIVIGYTD